MEVQVKRGVIKRRAIEIGVEQPFDLALFPDAALRLHGVDATERRVPLTAERRVRRTPDKPGIETFAIALPRHALSKVELDLGDGCGVVYGEGYHLLELAPMHGARVWPDPFFRRSAIRHFSTFEYLCRRVIASGELTPYAHVEVVKKLAYMALQVGNQSQMRSAVDEIASHYADAAGFKHHKGYSKEHPAHARASLLYIHFIGLIATGQFDRLIADMRACYETRLQVKTAPIVASNLSRALLMIGWALGRAGKTRQANVFLDATMACYRDASTHMPARRRINVLELNVALRCAGEAVGLQTQLRKAEGRLATNGRWIAPYSRIEGKRGRANFAAQMDALAVYLEHQPDSALDRLNEDVAISRAA